MELPDFSKVLHTYEQLQNPLTQWLDEASVQRFGQQLADKATSMQPRIMVYGVYNAGKSTLLNALIGRAAAPMADTPETAMVTPYPWRGYALLDTPGIDAPPEHDKVTREEFERCDVILFVVASGGVLDEAKTWHDLIEIIERGRRVMLIVNNKSGIQAGSDDFYLIADNLRQKLQQAAQAACVADVLTQVSIQMVNAQSALKARLEGKAKLLEHSGILALENNLAQFLRTSDSFTVLNTCRSDLLRLIDQAETNLHARHGDAKSSAMTKFRQRVAHERERLTSSLHQHLDYTLQEIHQQVCQAVNLAATQPDKSAASDALDRATRQFATQVGRQLNEHLGQEVATTRKNLRDMGHVLEADLAAADVCMSVPLGGDLAESAGPGLPSQMVRNAVAQMPVNDIVETGSLAALEFGKEHLPTFFKHVGHKTIQHWAHNIGRWAGPVVHAALFFWTIYRAYKDEAQRQADLIRQTQAIHDAVGEFINTLAAEYRHLIAQVVEHVFSPLEGWLEEKEAELSTLQGEAEEACSAFAAARLALDGD